jgi:tRNA dimethylallyltransferase
MLYFRALRHGLAELPQADLHVRATIDAEAAQQGWPALHAQLTSIDPVAAARIQPNDGQRIQRALEVFRLSGRTMTDLHAATALPDPSLTFASYAWVPGDRERLYQSIAARFETMMAMGLMEEVATLHQRGDLHSRLPAIRCVGYRQLWEHLEGVVSRNQSVENAVLATRHLARRQLVWLRADQQTRWIDALESDARAQMHRYVAAFAD